MYCCHSRACELGRLCHAALSGAHTTAEVALSAIPPLPQPALADTAAKLPASILITLFHLVKHGKPPKPLEKQGLCSLPPALAGARSRYRGWCRSAVGAGRGPAQALSCPVAVTWERPRPSARQLASSPASLFSAGDSGVSPFGADFVNCGNNGA